MLELSDTQLEQLQQLEGDDFLQLVRDSIVEDIPSLKGEPLLHRLRVANDHAHQLGVDDQATLTQFLYLEAIAEDFYTDPQIDAWLRKPGQPIAQRLQDLLATMQSQIVTGEQ